MRKTIPSIYLFSYSLASFTGHERKYLGRRSRPAISVKTETPKEEATA